MPFRSPTWFPRSGSTCSCVEWTAQLRPPCRTTIPPCSPRSPRPSEFRTRCRSVRRACHRHRRQIRATRRRIRSARAQESRGHGLLPPLQHGRVDDLADPLLLRHAHGHPRDRLVRKRHLRHGPSHYGRDGRASLPARGRTPGVSALQASPWKANEITTLYP